MHSQSPGQSLVLAWQSSHWPLAEAPVASGRRRHALLQGPRRGTRGSCSHSMGANARLSLRLQPVRQLPKNTRFSTLSEAKKKKGCRLSGGESVAGTSDSAPTRLLAASGHRRSADLAAFSVDAWTTTKPTSRPSPVGQVRGSSRKRQTRKKETGRGQAIESPGGELTHRDSWWLGTVLACPFTTANSLYLPVPTIFFLLSLLLYYYH